MIRVLAHEDGKPVVMLGLDPQNLNRLREGQPIVVNLARLNPDEDAEPTGLPDIDVVVFFAGEEETAVLVARFGGRT